MKFAAGLVLALASNASFAQGSPNVPAQSFQGGWEIGVGDSSAVISVGSLIPGNTPPGRWFLIGTNGTGPALAAANVSIDDQPMTGPMFVMGQVLVYGRKIVISKSPYAKADSVMGIWNVIDPAKMPGPVLAWSAFPQISPTIFVANLDSKREFVLSMGRTAAMDDCKGLKMIPVIDGKPLTDAGGKNLSYVQGNSLIAKGQKVEVRFEGVCQPGKFVAGSLFLI